MKDLTAMKLLHNSDSDPEKTEKEVKNAEQDISLAKNYCITVHMQKISSHLKFIFKIQQNQGIIQKKSASGSRALPFVIFDKKVPFLPKVVLL